MGQMQWLIKGVYLDPESLPFVSSWFVLMGGGEPNPGKADYKCIKFLKIAEFFNTTFAVEMQPEAAYKI